MTKAVYRGKQCLMETCLQFQREVHDHRSGEHGGRQAGSGAVAKIVHPDLQAGAREGNRGD